MSSRPNFSKLFEGAIYGLAIGDAMGAPVEGWHPEKISARFNEVKEFLPGTDDEALSTGKGNGRITDDTLMTEALMQAYIKCGDHMDAYDYAEYLLPEISEKEVWVPERQKNMPLLDRLSSPEKYPWQRIVSNNADPRSAGRGNCVNCGLAMFIMPVGAVNAGNPSAAYQEAVSFGLAHNESFVIEAAAVMAATSAKAFAENSTIEDVLNPAKEYSRLGTGQAINSVLAEVDPADSYRQFIAKVREAIAPYDQQAWHVSDDSPLKSEEVHDFGISANTAAIEELPVALAALKYGEGDFLKTLKAAVFYGRDCDTIAGMAGHLFGALYGFECIPVNLRSDVNTANKRDFTELANKFYCVIKNIFKKDEERFSCRKQTLTQ